MVFQCVLETKVTIPRRCRQIEALEFEEEAGRARLPPQARCSSVHAQAQIAAALSAGSGQGQVRVRFRAVKQKRKVHICSP